MHIYNYAHKSGGDWVPGSGGRRTASGPGGSSAKASPPGAQAYLMITGFVCVIFLGITTRHGAHRIFRVS